MKGDRIIFILKVMSIMLEKIHYLSNKVYEKYRISNGVKQGKATFTFANGDFEEYIYVDGIKQGKATFFKNNGDKEEYFYLNGIKEGEAKLYLKEGVIKKYYYRNGHKDYSDYLEINNLKKVEKDDKKFYYLNNNYSKNIVKEENKYNKIKVIFFDTETNGISSNNSVLSIAAIKVIVDLETSDIIFLDKYEKFYYPKENYFNKEAIKVNGLNEKVITEKRKNKNYPKYFIEDEESFFEFCDDCQHYVAHNINFDKRFLHRKLPKEFCTMRANSKIINLKNIKGGCKFPKLIETTEFYQIHSDEEKFHDSMYDVKMTIKVFEAMLTYNTVTRMLVKSFLLE